IFAYEALMRSSPKINPLTMIKHSRENGILYELDTLCIINAIKGYPFSYLKKFYLFINIFPSTIIHSNFKDFIDKILLLYPKIIGRVVFEINEDSIEEEIWGQEVFLNRLSYLKSLGFGIAFDDLPVAKSSFEKMQTIIPDFVKLDHTKSKGISYSIDKQQ